VRGVTHRLVFSRVASSDLHGPLQVIFTDRVFACGKTVPILSGVGQECCPIGRIPFGLVGFFVQQVRRRSVEEPMSRIHEEFEYADTKAQSIRFLLNVINATIYSSGDDYETAVEEFFPQVQALGCLLGATDLDEISEFLRRRSVWQ
jgi:hypothetical protein